MNLPGVTKIATCQIEILRHHAEREIFVTENSAHLPDHFFHAHVRACVSRAVVPREKQLEPVSGAPGLPPPKHPFELVELDEPADPAFQQKIGHGLESRPAPACRAARAAAPGAGQSRYL